MEHDVITEGIKKKDIVVVSKGTKGKVSRIKFKDGETFNYNKDKPVSIKLKDYLKQVKLHTSDGFKAHKTKIIDFVRNYFWEITKDEKGVLTRDYVLNKLILNKIIKTADIHDLPHEANQYIKTQITRHNNANFKEDFKGFHEQLNKGKFKYNLSFTVRVRNNVDGKVVYHNEERGVEFKHNLDKDEIPEKLIHDIVNMYYVWKDYSVIDELLKWKITKMNSKANIKSMDLWEVGFGRKFCNKLFKYTQDKIVDFDEKMAKSEYKQCVIMFLITTYHVLIDKKLINKEVLSESYINEFFKDKGGFNVGNLIEFIIHLKYANICIFDCNGIVPIRSYSVNDANINGDLKEKDLYDDTNNVNPQWYKKGLAIITENHIEGLHNDNAIQSATKNGYIKEFTTHITDDDSFDFFEDIEKKLMDDTYNEVGKNNDATVLLYDDTHTIEEVDDDDETYKAIDSTLSTTYRMIKFFKF